MKELNLKIESLKKIKNDIYLLQLNSPYLAKRVKPGQFIHIKVDDETTILRRPLSLHKVKNNIISILFRVRGRGTKLLSQAKPGDTLNVIGPLGNGFEVLHPSSEVINILVAGGMGVAPLVFLAERLAKAKNNKTKNLVLLGAKNKKEILAEQEFKKLGFAIQIATDDGSYGFKGNVVGLLGKILSAKDYRLWTDIYACGPKEMFYEIKKVTDKYPHIHTQVSFEQFMGCGLGICCGCVIETKNGYKKVCKDGPVFDLKDI